MTLRIEFQIEGPPIGKGRPKAVRMGNAVRMYTPKKTAEYETDIAFKAAQLMGDIPPLETPVEVGVHAYYPIPASWSKKRQQAAMDGLEIPGKPDLDNVAKAVLDALNGVVYVDDKQVITLWLTKRYSTFPHVRVWIDERVL
jgi:Holliday junction resolvase RusA-like endonuclease